MTKRRKLIEVTSISLILIVFIIIGYYTYQSYINQKNSNEDKVKIDNYYNIDFLFNNNYINTAKTISDFSDEHSDIYMYLDTSNVFYIKNTNKPNLNKKIKGLPSDEITLYYNYLDNYNYEFIAKTNKNEIYYVNLNIENKDDKILFSKVGDNIDSIYIPTYDKKGVYINTNNNITTNFIIVDKDKNIKYLDYKNKYVLKNDITSKKPYFDYICVPNICDNTIIYATFNNELSYKNRILTDKLGNKIFITDFFATFSTYGKHNISVDRINKSNIKKYNYILIIYAIDIDGNIYKLDINKNNSMSFTINEYSSHKVKYINYTKDKKLEIVYDNNKIETIEEEYNKKIIMSTIYEKSHLKT